MNIISTKVWTLVTTIIMTILIGHVRCQTVRIYVDGKIRDDELPEFMKPAGKAGMRMISCQVDYSGYARLQSVTLKKSAEGIGRVQRSVNMVVATMSGLSGVFSSLPERYASEYIVVSSRTARLNVYVNIQQPSDAGTFHCEATFQVGSQTTSDRSQNREFFPAGGFQMAPPASDKENFSTSATTIVAISACVAICAIGVTLIATCVFLSNRSANLRTASKIIGRPSQFSTNRKASQMAAASQHSRRISQLSALRSRAALGSRPSLVYSRQLHKPSAFPASIDDIRAAMINPGFDRSRKSLVGQNKVMMSAAELRRSASAGKDLRTAQAGSGARNSVIMAEAARYGAVYPAKQSLTFPGRDFQTTKAETDALVGAAARLASANSLLDRQQAQGTASVQRRAVSAGRVRDDASVLNGAVDKSRAGAAVAAARLSKVRAKSSDRYASDFYNDQANIEYFDDYRV